MVTPRIDFVVARGAVGLPPPMIVRGDYLAPVQVKFAVAVRFPLEGWPASQQYQRMADEAKPEPKRARISLPEAVNLAIDYLLHAYAGITAYAPTPRNIALEEVEESSD